MWLGSWEKRLPEEVKKVTMINNDADPFGVLLNTFRKRVRFTQQQLADAVGVHRHSVIRWEQGEMLPASKAIVLELARFLGLSDLEARQLLDASLTAPAPFWGVPFPRNLFFTGREAVLENLHRCLSVECASPGPRIFALQGLGGVGKTQTALEYAYRHSLEYSALFWIEAESLERVQFSLQRIAEILQLPECAATDQRQIVGAVQRWLSTHNDWLLIWDNLEDLELPQRVLSSPQGVSLFTTRRQALGTRAQGIDLQSMAHEEGILLLLRRAKLLAAQAPGEQVHSLAEKMPAEYAAASELVTTLGGLPLALDQAGAYLEETGCSVKDYRYRYEQRQAYLLDRRGYPEGDHPQSVMATFLLAKERAEHEQAASADLLRVCAFLHPDAIPEELFQAGAAYLGPELAAILPDPIQFDQTLVALRNLSLVQRQPHTRMFSLHRLVQAALRGQMEPAEERLWCARVVRAINAVFPEGKFVTWAQCERYLAQVMACVPLVALIGADLPEASELFSKAGCYLSEHGQLEEAEPLLAQAVALGEQHYGSEHVALIPLLTNQVELSWRQGKYPFAEVVSARLLVIEELHLEPTHVQIADTLNNLAIVYWEQGKYEQAEPLFQRALRIWEMHNHPDITTTLANLALLYWRQGKYEQAEPFCRRALRILEQRLGSEHPAIGPALNNLGMLYRDMGKDEQVEPLFQRALRIREQSLGSEHPEVAVSLHNLAVFYREQGKEEQAEPLLRRALHIREQALGSEHPDVAQSLGALAVFYRNQGKYKQSEQLVRRALYIQEQALGPEHPNVALSLNNLATVYKKQRKYKQAETLYEQALRICEQRLDASHLETARNLVDLADLYEQLDREEQAEPMLQRACDIFERRLGSEHRETVQTRNIYHSLLARRRSSVQAGSDK